MDRGKRVLAPMGRFESRSNTEKKSRQNEICAKAITLRPNAQQSTLKEF